MRVTLPAIHVARSVTWALILMGLLGLTCLPAYAQNFGRCGDFDLDAFDRAATTIETLEEREERGETVAGDIETAVVELLVRLTNCEGRLGRRALLFLVRAHTLRGDPYMEQMALSRLRRRDLSIEERKDLDERYSKAERPEDMGEIAAESLASPPEHHLGSGVAQVVFRRRGEELELVVSTEEVVEVRSLVVRWNPTGGGWHRVVVEGEPYGLGTVRFATRLKIPKQGRCFVQITARRRGATSVTSPEFVVNTSAMGDSALHRQFAVSSDVGLQIEPWEVVPRGTVRAEFSRHESSLRVAITSHLLDEVDGAVIRWNPIGASWLSKTAILQGTDAGMQRHTADLPLMKDGPCLIDIQLKTGVGNVRLSSFEFDTSRLLTGAEARTFKPVELSR